ncbi:MAG TPA: glycosyltransferase family 4 protein [Thermomicrobiales bacterium]|nr:glycosyltransferase family 4 protein [Thermomicrobiales bacterium]
MRVLLGVTYYRPHVSGLTIYAERLARALVAHGHQVTVLTSRYSSSLSVNEVVDGVHIVRVPVALRVSKGVIMPTLGVRAARLMREHDVLSLHLPMFDAAGLTVRARRGGTPVTLTYHCDLQLPPGPFNRVVGLTVHLANRVAARLADRIVAYTQDYADHSRLLRQFPGKLVVIPPPVVMPSPTPEDVSAFRETHGLDDSPVIGMAGRLAAEKGVEHLVAAMPMLSERLPNLKVLFAGPHREVIGEERYRAWLMPKIEALGDRWRFLGTLSPEALPAFYGTLDALLLTSTNSTESFGLVQVESMLCGTPVVATDLPGVRQPVRTTGMGEIVPPGDSEALASAVLAVLDNPGRYGRSREEIEQAFDIEVTIAGYERLFAELLAERREASTAAVEGQG